MIIKEKKKKRNIMRPTKFKVKVIYKTKVNK